MTKAIERRLAAAEQNLDSSTVDQTVIVFRGGLSSGDPTFAKAGSKLWERGVSETFKNFKARVLTSPEAAGQELVVFGGLSREPE